MLKIYLDQFDTKFLGKRVGKAHLDSPLTKPAALLSFVKKNRIKDFVCFTPFLPKNITAIETLGFHLTSIRVTYTQSLARSLAPLRHIPGLTFVQHSRSPGQIKQTEIRSLARIIGAHGRYAQDSKISHRTVENIFTAWITNSLYKHYVDEAFYAMHRSHLVGLITVKITKNTGTIDLLGVQKKYQGQGVGGVLMGLVLRYCKVRGLTVAQTVAAGEHIRTVAFYQRQGFTISDLRLVYSKHY